MYKCLIVWKSVINCAALSNPQGRVAICSSGWMHSKRKWLSNLVVAKISSTKHNLRYTI